MYIYDPLVLLRDWAWFFRGYCYRRRHFIIIIIIIVIIVAVIIIIAVIGIMVIMIIIINSVNRSISIMKELYKYYEGTATFNTVSASPGAGMQTLSVAFSMIGKFSITAAFAGVFLITPELYPTTVRYVMSYLQLCYSDMFQIVLIWCQTIAFGRHIHGNVQTNKHFKIDIL